MNIDVLIENLDKMPTVLTLEQTENLLNDWLLVKKEISIDKHFDFLVNIIQEQYSNNYVTIDKNRSHSVFNFIINNWNEDHERCDKGLAILLNLDRSYMPQVKLFLKDKIKETKDHGLKKLLSEDLLELDS